MNSLLVFVLSVSSDSVILSISLSQSVDLLLDNIVRILLLFKLFQSNFIFTLRCNEPLYFLLLQLFANGLLFNNLFCLFLRLNPPVLHLSSLQFPSFSFSLFILLLFDSIILNLPLNLLFLDLLALLKFLLLGLIFVSQSLPQLFLLFLSPV